MEGLYIPMLKLFDQGKVNETLMAMIRANTRLPVDTEGDVYSLAGRNDVGARRLVEMMDEFGIELLDQLGDHIIIARSREAVLAEIAKLPKGTWHNEMMIDGYDEPLTLKATLTISDGGIHVDYSGTSPASGRGINVPHAYTTAYTVFGLGCVVATHIPNNAARSSRSPCRRRQHDPQCAQAQRRRLASHHRPDAAGRDLRLPAPGRSRPRAGRGTSCLWNINVRGHVKGGEGGNYGFGMAITSNGGTGARPTRTASATAYPSGVRGTPVEIAETQTPLIFWRKEFRPDSGGAGRTRGGSARSWRSKAASPSRSTFGGVRPHRLSAARPRRRPGRRGGLRRQSGQT